MRNAAIKNPNSQNNQSVPRDVLFEHGDQSHSSQELQTDSEFQASMLQGVSRTFALTIPQLPESLKEVVSNAYLLCRIVDTIEDEPGLNVHQKEAFSHIFLEVLQGLKAPETLSSQLGPLLSHHTIPAEHQLISELHRVVSITRKFNQEQQRALLRCVRIMSEGMVYFQANGGKNGLKDQQEMDKYCYYVAGVVGEMLTELFCDYSSDIAKKRDQLFELSKSFGQGLQMTNILKDIWADHARSACWLPRDLFESRGLRLNHLTNLSSDKNFQSGIKQLVGIANSHLDNAIQYTLLIPANQRGIREFCLWALGMALLTLRKLNRNLNFTSGDQVKISRSSVKATILISGLIYRNNRLLKLWLGWLGRGLPKVPISTTVES